MGRSVHLLDNPAAIRPLARSWDALPAGRGVQADVYDGYSWFAAWLRAGGQDRSASVRIPVVLEDDRPVGMLPLVALSGRRWESLGRELRTRYRPVVVSERPDQETLALLVDAVGRSGVRDLTLHRLPSRDPATAAVADALSGGGFRVYRRERSSDCLATVRDGWEAHRDRFASYERAVKAKVKKIRQLWDLSIEAYGPHTGAPTLEGFQIYTAIHARSWKGTLGSPVREHREELLRRTDRQGWPRVYVLRVGGVPVAAHIWFRIGSVATWLSTVHDKDVAAISPGTIVMWWAQERLFDESLPRVMDLLPGPTAQKDALAPERPPLVSLEAASRNLVAGVTFPVRRRSRQVVPAVRDRVRRHLKRSGGRTDQRSLVRVVEAIPGNPTLPVDPLPLDHPTVRYLAVAGGHPGPEAMSAKWGDGDTWWMVGPGPEALMRMGPGGGSAPRPVREVVLVSRTVRPIEEFLKAIAGHVGVPVVAELPNGPGSGQRGLPILIHEPTLPPPAWLGSTTRSGRGAPRTLGTAERGDPRGVDAVESGRG